MRSETEIRNLVADAVETVRKSNPLTPSITNAITINFVANAQLAAGGSAAMVFLPEEAEIMAKAGDSFYINVGGLLPVHEDALTLAAKTLHGAGKPWTLDPVAIGIGTLRTGFLAECEKWKPSVIRGNASEIIALAGLWGLEGENRSNVRGVDSVDPVLAARASAVALARWTGGAVMASGETDLITDGKSVAFSRGGSRLMEKITGAGCSLGGVAAVFTAVAEPFVAALAAAAIYNLAGRRAERIALGPGTFQMHFLDELYRAAAKDVAGNSLEIEEV